MGSCFGQRIAALERKVAVLLVVGPVEVELAPTVHRNTLAAPVHRTQFAPVLDSSVQVLPQARYTLRFPRTAYLVENRWFGAQCKLFVQDCTPVLGCMQDWPGNLVYLEHRQSEDSVMESHSRILRTIIKKTTLPLVHNDLVPVRKDSSLHFEQGT